MRHRVSGKKLSRNRGQRKALFRGLISELIKRGEIETTEARAKAIKPRVDRLLTQAKKGELAQRRLLRSFLADKTLVKKLVDEIAPRFTRRPGGYTRMVRLGRRRGDNAMLVRVEWVEKETDEVKGKKEEKETRETKKKSKVG